MTEILPIFEQYSNEGPKETWARRKKETCALLKVYAHLAYDYLNFLEKKHGDRAPETQPYDLAGEESCFRAYSCEEWMDMYYHYNPLYPEEHLRSNESYRLEYHARYEKKLKELQEKMAATDYQAYLKGSTPEPSP